MGFPFDKLTWDVVEGAMFMGWGGSLPGLYTLISAIACVAILWVGNRSEKDQYSKHSN